MSGQRPPLSGPVLSFPPELLLQAQGVRAAIFDVDGVLTDGRIYLGEGGEAFKAFATLDAEGRASKIIMQVHDELVLEVPEAELDWARAEVPRLMASVATLRVPLLAEVGAGPNWEAAH